MSPVPTPPPTEPAPSLRPVEELQALCDTATPGPWHRIYDRVVTASYDEEADSYDFAAMQRRCTVAKTHPFEMRLSRDPRHIADAEFIAAARTALPSLLARLRAAEETLAAVGGEHYESAGQCVSCRDWDDNPADWPCPTAAALAEGASR